MTPTDADDWRAAFRLLAPSLPPRGLRELARALERDDPALLQGLNTRGDPATGEIVAACPFCYALWHGLHLRLRENVERAFQVLVLRLSDTHAGLLSDVLGFVDDAGRDEMRAAMGEEVRAHLERVGEA
jgi:hypothetical protein